MDGDAWATQHKHEKNLYFMGRGKNGKNSCSYRKKIAKYRVTDKINVGCIKIIECSNSNLR